MSVTAQRAEARLIKPCYGECFSAFLRRASESSLARDVSSPFSPFLPTSSPFPLLHPLDALENSNWKSGIAQCQRMLLKVKSGPNHHVVLVSLVFTSTVSELNFNGADLSFLPPLLPFRPSSPSTFGDLTTSNRPRRSHSSWRHRRSRAKTL